MRDVELLVRFLAFRMFLFNYAGRMKEFVDDSCVKLNRDWAAVEGIIRREAANFVSGIEALEQIFGTNRIARKLGSQLFNRSIFDALIYYASRPDVREAMIRQSGAVRAAYEGLIGNAEFQEAIESDTAGLPHTATRLMLWGQVLGVQLGMRLAVPEVEVRKRRAAHEGLTSWPLSIFGGCSNNSGC